MTNDSRIKVDLDYRFDTDATAATTAITAWNATLPCPECGGAVLGYVLVDETGAHQHTRYACTRWVRPPEPPGGRSTAGDWGGECGWRGWTVPGWDDPPTHGESEFEYYENRERMDRAACAASWEIDPL